MSQAPLGISIALCTYNSEAYLREQLESFLQQTWLAHEIVVVDDGSRDETFQILEAYSRNLPLKIHRNEKNLGFVKSFEKALSLCIGEIVFPSDHDDIWHPDKLEKSTKPFLEDPSLLIVFCDARLVDSAGRCLSKKFWNEIRFTRDEREKFKNNGAAEILVKKAVAAGNSLAIRNNFLKKALPIPAGWLHDEWLMALAAFSGKILPLDEPLLSYRQHTNQAVGVAHAGLLAKLKSRVRRADTRTWVDFDRDWKKWQALRERLNALGTSSSMLNQKILFHARCAAYSPNRLIRFSNILWALVKGDYDKFGNGWPTAIRDWLSQ